MRQLAAPRGPERESGISRLEVMVSVIIVAILAGLLLERLVFYQEQAELAEVHRTLNAMRAELNLRVAALHAQHREDLLPAFVEQNPVDWLRKAPANYLGEYYSPDKQDVQDGNWYFDRTSKTLVYLLHNGKTFLEGKKSRLIFKVKLSRLPSNSAKPAATSGNNTGVALDQVTS